MLNVRGVVLATLAALAFSFTALSANNNHDAQYLGGSVKDIDEKTPGTLSLSDPVSLEFQHGSSNFTLPYANIRSFQFTKLKAHRTLAHVPVPNSPFRGKHLQALSIRFRQEDGTVGTASFRITESSRNTLQSQLKEKIDSLKNSAGREKSPDAWWGDKYWKTTRNKTAWPDQSTTNAPLSAGAK